MGQRLSQIVLFNGDIMAGDSQWMLPPEIYDYLCQKFPNGGNILEFGSGDGTVILSQSFEICSVEHDEEWAKKIVTPCYLIPITPNEFSTTHQQIGWYDVEQVKGVIPEDLEIVIIDGPTGTIGRHGILSIVDFLPKSAIFIIDDVHRDEEFDLYEKLLEWHGGKGLIHTAQYESGEIRQWASLSPRGGEQT